MIWFSYALIAWSLSGAISCAFLTQAKGYNIFLGIVFGILGGVVAVIDYAGMPSKKQEQLFNALGGELALIRRALQTPSEAERRAAKR